MFVKNNTGFFDKSFWFLYTYIFVWTGQQCAKLIQLPLTTSQFRDFMQKQNACIGGQPFFLDGLRTSTLSQISMPLWTK